MKDWSKHPGAANADRTARRPYEPQQREYVVRWVIEVDADSPEDAARQAREMATDPDTLATIYEVCLSEDADDPSRADWVSVDLAKD